MPEMDGFDLAVRIKISPHLTEAVVMMLTSGEQRGDVRRAGSWARHSPPLQETHPPGRAVGGDRERR